MKKTVFNSFVLAFATLLLFSQCTTKETLTAEQIKAKSKQATIFAYQLVEGYKAIGYSNIMEKKTGQPFYNNFTSLFQVYTPDEAVGTAPNTDVIYVGSMFDLRTEPLVIKIPEISDRYYTIMYSDMFGDVFGYTGTRTTGTKAGTYLLLPPDWQGEVDKTKFDLVLQSKSYIAIASARVTFFGGKDIDVLKKNVGEWKILPLSAYLNNQAPKQAEKINYPPMFDARTGDAEGFYNIMAFMLPFQVFDSINSDKNELDNLTDLGIIARKEFKIVSTWTAEMKKALQDGLDEAKKEIAAKAELYRPLVNNWNYSPDNAGKCGRDYLMRSATAWNLIWPNEKIEAFYPTSYIDNNGDQLNGSNANYVFSMKPSEIPPVNAYWSVTVYKKSTGLLSANPANKYSVNSIKSKFKTEQDGRLNIYLQYDSPGKDKEENWIPVPKEDFFICLRLYWPKQEVLDETWKPATVTKQ